MIRILNDLHVGVQRSAGTTLATQFALKDYARDELKRLLYGARNVLIAGDLFDAFTVETSELIKVYNVFVDWFKSGAKELILVMGNHDYSPRAEKVSSFHMLAHFLKHTFPGQVHLIDHKHGLEEIESGLWCIPHMPNQDLFDLEMKKAMSMGRVQDHTLILHANYRNTFAENSDHSLNIGKEQVDTLMTNGWSLLIAHEHQGYDLRGGRIKVVGNQFPTSVSDCIGEKFKRYFEFTSGQLEEFKCWKPEGEYIEVEWEQLASLPLPHPRFIRVTGTAAAEQAADVVSTIADFRQQSLAMVVGNAVKIGEIEGMEALAEVSFEDVTSFDVLSALLAELDEREGEVIRSLLEEQ